MGDWAHDMNLVWGALVIIAVTRCGGHGDAIGAAERAGWQLHLRRRRPGIWGCSASSRPGSPILLGFISFLAFPELRPITGGRRDRGLVLVQQVGDGSTLSSRHGQRADRRSHLLRKVGRPRRVGSDAGQARSATPSTRGALRCSAQ